MGKIIDFIEKVTNGKCFKSFKYCYDDIQNPNIEYDKYEDRNIYLAECAETTKFSVPRDLRKLAKESMAYSPLFKFFLDGSRRVYKVDDIQYDSKVYPIICGQISVACCKREIKSDNTFDKFGDVCGEFYPVICLPVTANGNGGEAQEFFNNLSDKITRQNSLFTSGKVLYYLTDLLKANETLENRGIARIQDEMIECEKNIVANIMGERHIDQNSYMIKDGSIQYKTMRTGDYKELAKIKNNYRHVVGVSKKFNPNLIHDKKGKSVAGQIAMLPLYHRTPAFRRKEDPEFGNVPFAIWYVRIRDTKYTSTPYSGILKIEKILITDKEVENGIDTEEIDMISANIINERNPVCYGNDSRWANHLYPVYMTECYSKSRFRSDISFINMF